MPSAGSDMNSSRSRRRRLTIDNLFRLINQTYRSSSDDYRYQNNFNNHDGNEIVSQSNDYINGISLSELDLRHLWLLLSNMIRSRLLKHEPCLLPELGAFVIIEHPSSDNSINLSKEPFFVLDTTFARRHRLSRIKKTKSFFSTFSFTSS